MTVEPSYGETPVSDDEAAALQSPVASLLGNPPLKAEIYDLEQTILGDVAAELLAESFSGELGPADLLADAFVVDLHRRLYADIWTWGGTLRRREVTIGVAPEQIAVQLRSSLDSYLYRWEQTTDWTPRQFAMAVHAETVRIHPFVDGNGRTTRLLADLVFAAVQSEDGSTQLFDWDVDKPTYISLLRAFDQDQDPGPLAEFIPVRGIES